MPNLFLQNLESKYYSHKVILRKVHLTEGLLSAKIYSLQNF